MTPAEFIDTAIDRGQTLGADALSDLERMVFIISEAEVHCSKDGIDSFIDRYGRGGLSQAAEAFAAIGASELAHALEQLAQSSEPFPESMLNRANTLIVEHAGWDYDSIYAAVAARLQRDT